MKINYLTPFNPQQLHLSTQFFLLYQLLFFHSPTFLHFLFSFIYILLHVLTFLHTPLCFVLIFVQIVNVKIIMKQS